MDSEALQGVSECDGYATGNGAQYPTTVPQGPPGIVTVWVAFAPLRCIVWIDAIKVRTETEIDTVRRRRQRLDGPPQRAMRFDQSMIEPLMRASRA